jgi:hypothetical protein
MTKIKPDKTNKTNKPEKIVEIIIPLKPKPIIQAPVEGMEKKNNFSHSKKSNEELKRLFCIDKNNEPIVYPTDSFEYDSGWIESVFGKGDSDFRRTIHFKSETTQDLINETILFIKNNCNPGTDKEYAGWLSYANEDEPNKLNLKTRTSTKQ